MNLVIDTNIVFSALLNPRSIVGEVLMNVQDEVTFFAPELLKVELRRYTSKIISLSKLSVSALADLETLLFSNITFVSEELISEPSWIKAFALTKDVDENDTPFVALAIELNTKLWTGDKKLLNGLSAQTSDLIMTTVDLKTLFN